MKRITWLVLAAQLFAGALGAWAAGAAGVESWARQVSSLVDPAKLATLGPRGANPRVQKYVALLAGGRGAGAPPETVVARAVALVGMKGEAAKLTAEAMLRNLVIAERLGCLDAEGMAAMRRGKAPTITKGPYRGDRTSVDHIIPRAVAPELDTVIANLEVMPLRMNESKNAKIGARQVDLARKFRAAGLLSAAGLVVVLGR